MAPCAQHVKTQSGRSPYSKSNFNWFSNCENSFTEEITRNIEVCSMFWSKLNFFMVNFIETAMLVRGACAKPCRTSLHIPMTLVESYQTLILSVCTENLQGRFEPLTCTVWSQNGCFSKSKYVKNARGYSRSVSVSQVLQFRSFLEKTIDSWPSEPSRKQGRIKGRAARKHTTSTAFHTKIVTPERRTHFVSTRVHSLHIWAY